MHHCTLWLWSTAACCVMQKIDCWQTVKEAIKRLCGNCHHGTTTRNSSVLAKKQQVGSMCGVIHIDGDDRHVAVTPLSKKQAKNMCQSQLITSIPSANSIASIDTAIADFLLSNALPPPSLSECLKLKLLIQAAKHVPLTHEPPSRQTVAGPLPNANCQTVVAKMISQLQQDSTKYGLMIFGDGATIVKRPSINMLCLGVNNHATLLDVADCLGHVAKGNKKDAECIAKLWSWTKIKQGLLHCMFECACVIVCHLTLHVHFCHATMSCYLGLIYVPLAGQLMWKRWEKFCQNISLRWHAFMVLSTLCLSFLGDVFHLPQLKMLVSFYNRLCNFFGSVQHSPAAMFRKHSKAHNGGVAIGFIKIAETCMHKKWILFCVIISPTHTQCSNCTACYAVLCAPNIW